MLRCTPIMRKNYKIRGKKVTLSFYISDLVPLDFYVRKHVMNFVYESQWNLEELSRLFAAYEFRSTTGMLEKTVQL